MKLYFTPPNQGYSPSHAPLLSKGSMPLQSVRSLSESRRQMSATSTNVGNLIHCEAVAKTFDVDLSLSSSGSIERLYKVECKQRPAILHSKLKHFDGVVFSFANLISLPLPGHEKRFDERFNFLTELVEAINIPIFVFGMGMQTAIPDLSTLPDSMKSFLGALNAKAALWGVRGVETEKFLHSLGLTTAEALGCPSLYVYPESILNIKPIEKFEGTHGMTAGYLDRRHLLGYRPERLEALHRLNSAFRLSYVFQNDLYTLQELETVEGLFEDATNMCSKPILEDYFSSFGQNFDFESYHFFRDPRGWREFANGKDFYFGDRFHGGVAAMQVGRPSLFIWNDLRVRELTGHFNIPSVSLDDFIAGDPMDLMTDAASKVRLDQMKEVYEERAQHYFARTAEFNLAPLHERYKVKKHKSTVHTDDTAEQLMEAFGDSFVPDEVVSTLRLFANTNYNVGISERLIGVASSQCDARIMFQLSKVLIELGGNMSGWTEDLVFKVARILMRDKHYDAARIILETVCQAEGHEQTERSIQMYIEALARTGKPSKATEVLSAYRDNDFFNATAIHRLDVLIERSIER